jgi:hypothetical protein
MGQDRFDQEFAKYRGFSRRVVPLFQTTLQNMMDDNPSPNVILH